MKIFLLLVAVGAVKAGSDHYVTADDNFDMDAAVNNPVKMMAMTDCFLDRGPCDHIAQSFKDIIPDSIMKACQRCNDAQKHLANVYMNGLKTVRPDDYEKFLDKYDAQRFYIDSFLEAVKNY